MVIILRGWIKVPVFLQLITSMLGAIVQLLLGGLLALSFALIVTILVNKIKAFKEPNVYGIKPKGKGLIVTGVWMRAVCLVINYLISLITSALYGPVYQLLVREFGLSELGTLYFIANGLNTVGQILAFLAFVGLILAVVGFLSAMRSKDAAPQAIYEEPAPQQVPYNVYP